MVGKVPPEEDPRLALGGRKACPRGGPGTRPRRGK